MIVLNFAHPFTSSQLASVTRLTGGQVERGVDLPTRFDQTQHFAKQSSALLKSTVFSTTEWQTLSLLVNLPSFNAIAAAMLAELHGRMGYFPAVLRLQPISNTTPPQFEVAEII